MGSTPPAADGANGTPTALTTVRSPALRAVAAVVLAVASTCVFAIALGVANGLAVIATSYGWPALAGRLIQAFVCTVVTLVGVGWLVRRTGADLAWAGLHRAHVGRDLATGFGVVLGSAAVVLGGAVALGEVEVTAVAVPELVAFLVLTLVVAVGLEAFPEELAFRGLAFSALRAGTRPWLAAVLSTVLFVLSVGGSQVVTAVLVRAADAGRPPWYSPAPTGEDPGIYLPFLVVWSICLLCARLVTGSVWTAVPAHLLMLVVNRLLLDPSSGVQVTMRSPDVLIAVPAYVLLAAGVFALLSRRRAGREWSLSSRPAPAIED